MGCSVCGELLFPALLGPGCQHGAAAAPRHQPWAGTSASLAGAGETPDPPLGKGTAVPALHGAAEQELSTAMPGESDQELQPCCPEILEKPGRGGEVPAGRNQWFQNIPGIFTALKCQRAQGQARTASAAKDSTTQGFGHCWPRQCSSCCQGERKVMGSSLFHLCM